MNPFPGQFTILRPETWPAGIAAGKYAGQPLKASCASYAEGLAQLALSPVLGPVYKRKGGHADADRRRENDPQRDEAGKQSRARSEYIIHDDDMPVLSEITFSCLESSGNIADFPFHIQFCLSPGPLVSEKYIVSDRDSHR